MKDDMFLRLAMIALKLYAAAFILAIGFAVVTGRADDQIAWDSDKIQTAVNTDAKTFDALFQTPSDMYVSKEFFESFQEGAIEKELVALYGIGF